MRAGAEMSGISKASKAARCQHSISFRIADFMARLLLAFVWCVALCIAIPLAAVGFLISIPFDSHRV
jgi:hypothetical protein